MLFTATSPQLHTEIERSILVSIKRSQRFKVVVDLQVLCIFNCCHFFGPWCRKLFRLCAGCLHADRHAVRVYNNSNQPAFAAIRGIHAGKGSAAGNWHTQTQPRRDSSSWLSLQKRDPIALKGGVGGGGAGEVTGHKHFVGPTRSRKRDHTHGEGIWVHTAHAHTLTPRHTSKMPTVRCGQTMCVCVCGQMCACGCRMCVWVCDRHRQWALWHSVLILSVGAVHNGSHQVQSH